MINQTLSDLWEQAECFWFENAITTNLNEIGNDVWFVTIKLVVTTNSAMLIYEDGNGYEHARQAIEFTDFPFEHMTHFVCWDGSH